eukprot:CAMPEP_0197529522 /NCGR_PEP_ID=MMETSP1318-20131121/28641_1 /TAXON_ID=552666 /ORGANISM="Partenskyella glossopodia, Strain RCC365" /LENGTH=334 /DNA_ID=CAMNT_0043085013 /DNA_START=202 /DNA_END=1203 /DNA_ORIENTATION=+
MSTVAATGTVAAGSATAADRKRKRKREAAVYAGNAGAGFGFGRGGRISAPAAGVVSRATTEPSSSSGAHLSSALGELNDLNSPPPPFVVENDDFDFDEDEVPCDTLAAIQWLVGDYNPKKVVLQHQIYSLVKDRTQVDREVSRLRLRNKIRVFEIPAAQGCQAVMLHSDYLDTVHGILIGEGKAAGQVGRAFLECTSDLKSVDVDRRQLVRLIQSKAKGVRSALEDTHTGSISSMSDDRILTHLVNLGLVLRKSVEEFYFAIPDVGALLIDIRNARKEIRRIVNRCMYKEILLKELEKKKLKKSRMGIQFHIRDMHGINLLEFIDTNLGILVRL